MKMMCKDFNIPNIDFPDKVSPDDGRFDGRNSDTPRQIDRVDNLREAFAPGYPRRFSMAWMA